MIDFNPKMLELGRWTLQITNGPDCFRGGRGWRIFRIGFFKLNRFPPDGNRLSRCDYSGFRLGIAYWWPIELEKNW